MFLGCLNATLQGTNPLNYETFSQLATKRGGFHHRYVTVDNSGSVWAGATAKSPEAFGMT